MEELRFTRAFIPSMVMDAETETEAQATRRSKKFVPGCSKGIKRTAGYDYRRPAPKGLCRCKHCHHLTSNRGAVCWWCLQGVERPTTASQRLARIARKK